MGGALLDGWLASPTPPRLVVLDRHRTGSDDTVTIVRTAAEIPADFQPDIIVLAVKPSVAEIVIDALGKALGPRLSGAAILSVMAGRTCETLSDSARLAGADRSEEHTSDSSHKTE